MTGMSKHGWQVACGLGLLLLCGDQAQAQGERLTTVCTSKPTPAEECAGLDLQETDSFVAFMEAAGALGRQVGASQTFIGFDIDNTLLANNTALGSDQWFGWRDRLGGGAPNGLACLIAAQGNLFRLGSMRLTEKDLPGLIENKGQEGFKAAVVTARGPGFQIATLKEFARNRLDFRRHNPPSDLAGDGILYRAGILFTSGKNKGEMVRRLINGSPDKLSAVAFIDDNQTNVCRVQRCMEENGVPVQAFRYTGQDAAIAAFQDPPEGEACAIRKRAAQNWMKTQVTIERLQATFGTALYPTTTGAPDDADCTALWKTYAETPACP